MASRRRARQRALQILFIWDARKQPVEDAINAYYDALYSRRAPDPFVAVGARHGGVPGRGGRPRPRHADWRMERMPAVDRNILRLAVYEMTRGGTPAPVTIDEALELARKFSGEESVQFVNGVLDAVRREMT
jgi:N utilization substance protein B